MAKVDAMQRHARKAQSINAAMIGVLCLIGVVACSGNKSRATVTHVEKPSASQIVRDHEVLVVPIIQGGAAGWCLRNVMAPKSPCGVPEVSGGPIFAEGCNASSPTVIEVYALTSKRTAAVSVGGGLAIPTRVEVALSGGLRAALVEIRYSEHPDLEKCPGFTPLDASGRPIRSGQALRSPLGVLGRGVVQWRRRDRSGPVHLPHGVCVVGPTDIPGFSARLGTVVRRVRPSRGLFGRAFASCVSTEYFSRTNGLLSAAVLLDATNPGSAPGPLPGMKPVRGHPGVVEAPGPGAELVARRLRGAWLVVQEGGAGLREPLTLLEHLYATVHL
jgi:hypothetical protein